MSHEHHFACRLQWTGAAHGGTTAYDAYSREYEITVKNKPILKGSAAVPFRGDASLHNPEDLLMASLSACHFLSYAAWCARKKIVLVSYGDDAVGKMEMSGGKIRFTEVVLRPHAVIASGDLELAKKLHEAAHEECFIANSVNFPVRHEAVVLLQDSAK
ncbi:MAG: OsmC family protein [Polyangiaceae bacterium]